MRKGVQAQSPVWIASRSGFTRQRLLAGRSVGDQQLVRPGRPRLLVLHFLSGRRGRVSERREGIHPCRLRLAQPVNPPLEPAEIRRNVPQVSRFGKPAKVYALPPAQRTTCRARPAAPHDLTGQSATSEAQTPHDLPDDRTPAPSVQPTMSRAATLTAFTEAGGRHGAPRTNGGLQ